MTTTLEQVEVLATIKKVDLNARYTKQLIYFISSVIALLTVINVFLIIWHRVSAQKQQHKTNELTQDSPDDIHVKHQQIENAGGPRRGKNSIRRIPLAILNTVRALSNRYTVPIGFGFRFSLLEIIITIIYCTAVFVWTFINCQPYAWANRAGTLATGQLTFVVALAGKNNVLSLLTGITYEKLNFLHRLSSRMLVLLIWIHMWGRWKIGLKGKTSMAHGWLKAGVVSVVALTLLAVLSVRKLRNTIYEYFVWSHRILAFIMLLTAYFHVRQFPNYTGYVWPPLLVWGVDRALRFARTVHFHYLARKGLTGNALVEILPGDTMRVTINVNKTKLLTWKAGQHAYITIPCASPFPFEAHPFTIASADLPSDAGNGKTLKFIIRRRNGFTRRLYEYVSQHEQPECWVPIYFDGPYGSPPEVHPYENVVLLAGGSGISYTLPLLTDVTRRSKSNDGACNRIVFVWIIRKREHMKWIASDLMSLASSSLSGLDIDLRIFVTNEADSATASVDELSKNEKDGQNSQSSSVEKINHETSLENDRALESLLQSHPNITCTISCQRPIVTNILKQEISVSKGHVSVHVSGPESLTSDVRSALCTAEVVGPSAIMKGGPGIFLHVENFGFS